jgi:HEAT repeat protein
VAHRGRQNADEALALAVASGQSLRDAAAAVCIGERTATRRAADPDFRQRVAELRTEMTSRALGRLADGMSAAADTLRQLLDAESESVRLGAARALLELGTKLREAIELASKVDELEQLLKGGGNEPEKPNRPAAGSGAGTKQRPASEGKNPAPQGPDS